MVDFCHGLAMEDVDEAGRMGMGHRSFKALIYDDARVEGM